MRASEKSRALSRAQSSAQTPPVGAGWTSQTRFSVAWSSPKIAVALMSRMPRPTTVARVPPLWGRGAENASHELAAGRAHEAFDLGGQLVGHLLPRDHQPRHADDEQHQRRQGQGGVERQGRGEA